MSLKAWCHISSLWCYFSRSEEHWKFSLVLVHEQALFCMYACACVRSSQECGLGLVSGSRQHMPDTALWGPAFIPCCFHSPTFARCTKKVVFSSLCIPAKKVLAFTFTHTWIVAVHLIPSTFQLCCTAPKICTISSFALNRSGIQDKQTNCWWYFIKHIFPNPSFIREICIYLGH